jgi:hypothetical protein
MLLRRPGAAVATLLFVVLGAALLTQMVPYRQILDSQRQVSSARAQLAALEEDNTLLAADAAARPMSSSTPRSPRPGPCRRPTISYSPRSPHGWTDSGIS